MDSIARWARRIAALILTAALLEAAEWAVRDCSAATDTSANCLWLAIRGRLGLRENKALRAGVLEGVGLSVLIALWLTFCYVWPSRQDRSHELKADPPNQRADAVQLERQVLRALCQDTPDGLLKASARELLTGYRWRDPSHLVVFDMVMSFPSLGAAALREQLPGRLTRRGFPDFDFAALFAPPAALPSEVQQWMGRLRKLA